MRAWIGRNRGTILFALSLLATGLLIANVWKSRIVSLAWLAAQKDAIGALSGIVATVVLVIGSIFSYFRFFHGRTLSLRTELAIAVSVHNTDEDYLIHAITLSAKNVGGVTIWNPLPHISLRVHGPGSTEEILRISDWTREPTGSVASLSVIDPGETATFFALRRIPNRAWAVTYAATLRADRGDAWHVSKTVSNKASCKDG